MKRLLILFGILDVVTLFRSYEVDTRFTSASPYFLGIIIGNLLLISSLLFSAYFLIRQNRVGLWLTYGQFPLRLLFMVLSFGFLLTMNRYFQLGEFGYKLLILVIMLLEVVRLTITILIHRKFFRRTSMTPLN